MPNHVYHLLEQLLLEHLLEDLLCRSSLLEYGSVWMPTQNASIWMHIVSEPWYSGRACMMPSDLQL